MSQKYFVYDGKRWEKKKVIEEAKSIVQEEIVKCNAAYMEMLAPDMTLDELNRIWRLAFEPWMEEAYPCVAFLYKVLGFNIDKARDWIWEATNNLLLAETMRMNIEANLDIPVRPVNAAMFVKTG